MLLLLLLRLPLLLLEFLLLPPPLLNVILHALATRWNGVGVRGRGGGRAGGSRKDLHLLEAFVDGREQLLLIRQALVHGAGEARQLGARRGRGLHNCPEEAARILWCAHSELFLEASISADLIHERNVPTEIPNE